MLRSYQIELAEKAFKILKELKIVYLAMEMRVGKTLIAMKTAELIGAKKVLCVTKKKAINSIQNDYQREGFKFRLTVINYEQLDKYGPEYDLVIVDEAHSTGAFPKPSKRTQLLKNIIGYSYLILLSGTPSPETYTQLYFQFWISMHSPWEWSNFYKWAHQFVDIKERVISSHRIRDYTRAYKDRIMNVLEKYFVRYTQEEAGFQQKDIKEEIIFVDVDDKLRLLIKLLLMNRYYLFKDGNEIVCDTSVKLQNKIHQIWSGSIKLEDGNYKILDCSKVEYIKQHYQGKKIAIFYKYVAEGDILKRELKNWTDSPEAFNRDPGKIFISQIQSGSMGINLSSADVLIFYNIDFSATMYWQSRARLQALEREKTPLVHWLFSKDGIEKKIYDVVLKKRSYTTYYFQKHYLKENCSAKKSYN